MENANYVHRGHPMAEDQVVEGLLVTVKPQLQKQWGRSQAVVYVGAREIATIEYAVVTGGPMWYWKRYREDIPLGRSIKSAAKTVLFHLGYCAELPVED